MKLTKKMLVCLMALAIVSVFAFSAMATNVSVSGGDYKVGDTVTVTVTASALAGAKSANYEISYNHDVLEFVSGSGPARADTIYDDTDAAVLIAVPKTAAEVEGAGGVVTIAFAAQGAITDEFDDATLATFTFTAKAAGKADFKVSVVSFSGNGDCSASAAAVNVKGDEVTTEEKTTEEKTTEEKTTEEKTTEEKTTQEKTTEEKTTEKKPEEPTSEVVPEVEGEVIIVKEGDFVKGDELKDKADACDKAEKAAKAAKAGKVAKVAQTGDAAVAVIAGIMAIGAVGFIATKKREF